MDGGANIVIEIGKGEFIATAHAAAGGVAGFDEEGVEALAGERDGGGEAVGAGADDNGIVAG